MSTQRHTNCLIVVMTACLALPHAGAQSPDPLARNSIPGDPFVEPTPPAGNPIVVRFKVVDERGAPLPGAMISAAGSRNRPRTDPDGVAVWRTTDQQLLTISKGNSRTVSFTIFPPRDRLMPKMFGRFSADKLLEEPVLTFRGKNGMQLKGTVIGSDDRKPVQNVRLYITPKGFAEPTKSNFFTTTDEQGNWSIVVPRMDAQIVADGIVAGYDIGNGIHYSKTVESLSADDSIEVPDFEIRQIPLRNVVVVGEKGESIADATVQAQYEQWLDDKIVVWQSFSPTKVTDGDGRCRLSLENVKWSKAFVVASHEIDGTVCVGRSALEPDANKLITIRLRRPMRISGRLTRGGEPAIDVGLVIYETVDEKDRPRGWSTIQLRGETRTDELGRYEFECDDGRRYAIAMQERDSDGVQQLLYRTSETSSGEPFSVPDLDIATAPLR